MNKTRAEARDYARRLRALLTQQPPTAVQPFVLPPLTSLDVLVDEFAGWDGCLLGAQNGHWADSGAWTGEVSMPMLADAGARMVELGHAERREHFGETDETVALKVGAALRRGLIPVVCVGEPADVRAAGGSADFICRQAEIALRDVDDISTVIIAYEPVWAIGTLGRPPRADEIAGPIDALGSMLRPRGVRAIIYGGSVDQSNAGAILDGTSCDGLFVGRAALTADGFAELVALGSTR